MSLNHAVGVVSQKSTGENISHQNKYGELFHLVLLKIKIRKKSTEIENNYILLSFVLHIFVVTNSGIEPWQLSSQFEQRQVGAEQSAKALSWQQSGSWKFWGQRKKNMLEPNRNFSYCNTMPQKHARDKSQRVFLFSRSTQLKQIS